MTCNKCPDGVSLTCVHEFLDEAADLIADGLAEIAAGSPYISSGQKKLASGLKRIFNVLADGAR